MSDAIARIVLLASAVAPAAARWVPSGSDAEAPGISCADAEVAELARGERVRAVCAGDRDAAARFGCPGAPPPRAGERQVLAADCSASYESLAGAQLLMLGRKLDVNRASAEDLADLPGVGPGLASRIVRERVASGSFRSMADLERVPGMGATRAGALAEAAEVR